MTILHRPARPVHFNLFADDPDDLLPPGVSVVFPFEGFPAADDFDPADGDTAWMPDADDAEWAARTFDSPATTPDPATDCDRAWVADEAHGLGHGPDPTGARALACDVLLDLAYSMRFHRHETAAGYLDDPNTAVPRPAVADLRAPLTRRSPLALGLDVLASWYLHLDTDAGSLAAHALLRTADEAEELGSGDADDFRADEAARRAEAIDRVCAGHAL